MSSTPPNKGQKQPALQTPWGKLLAKASRASSPTEMMEFDDLLVGWPSNAPWPLTTTFLFGNTSPHCHIQLQNSPLWLTAVWIWCLDCLMEGAAARHYLAQYKEQHGHLPNLFMVTIASLWDLPGSGELEKLAVPAMYTLVTATSAPKPRPPRKGKSAPTTKHIQYAITCFECVSKELQGALRDTITKVVSNSNLNTAPNPLLETPQPQKKLACLVKGIWANTMAAVLYTPPP